MSNNIELKKYVLLSVIVYDLYSDDKNEYKIAFHTMKEMLKYQSEYNEQINRSAAYDVEYNWREDVSEQEIRQSITVDEYFSLHSGLKDIVDDYITKNNK